MEAIFTQAQDIFEGQIDFAGQQFAETLSNILLTLSAVVALIVGFVQQDIYVVLWTGLAGTILTMLLVVPPWPIYNQKPQPWIGSKHKLNLPRGGIVVSNFKAT